MVAGCGPKIAKLLLFVFNFSVWIEASMLEGMTETIHENYGESTASTEIIDEVQIAPECSGASGYADYVDCTNRLLRPVVPVSCCVPVDDGGNNVLCQAGGKGVPTNSDKVNGTGCVEASIEVVQGNFVLIGAICCALIIFEFCRWNNRNATLHSSFNHILFAITLLFIAQKSKSENQLVIVQHGDVATLRFNTSWPSTSLPDAVPYFTLRFESMNRPFCINGETDPNGLLHISQYGRFTVIPNGNSDSLVVYLVIQDVNIHDVGSYVLTLLLVISDGEFDTTEVISLQVTIPPGKAECFISKNKETSWPEVHCRATAGSGNATLSCFQNNVKLPYKGGVARNGDMIRGIFWKISSNHLHCCSHEWKDDVTQDFCLDFVFPSQPKIITATLDTHEADQRTSTKSYWDRTSTEHVQGETLAYRSFATRECPTVAPFIIVASLILYSQR